MPPQDPEFTRLERAKRIAKERLMMIDGVEGVGIGDGAVHVYVRDETIIHLLPERIEGVPLRPVITGEIVAY